MTAQVLDEFVVKLGFDIAALRKGQAEALARLDAFEKGADHARRKVAESGKGMAEIFASVRNQVFALTSAFIGFNALKSAVVDITKADAALGRLSRTLNIEPATLKAFEGVGERYGATASQMDDAFSHIAQTMAQSKVGIYDQEMLTAFSRMGVAPTAFFDKTISDVERFKLVTDALNKSIASGIWNDADIMNFGAKMGFSPEVVRVMLDTKGKLDDLIESQQKMNEVNKADTAQAMIRTQAWNTATNTFEHYERVVLNGLTELMSADARAARAREGDRAPATLGRVAESAAVVIGDILSDPFSTLDESGAAKKLSDIWVAGGKQVSSGIIGRTTSDANVNERNNNPGNIEYGPFARSHGATGSDGRFAIFPDLAAGAAAQRALMLHHGAHGARSLRDLIMKWSPPSDNSPGNTEAYIADVAAQTGLDPTAALDYGSDAIMSAVQLATARHEGMSHRGMAAMQGVIPSTSSAARAGNTQTSTTNIGTINVNAPHADAREVVGEIRNNLTTNASALGGMH